MYFGVRQSWVLFLALLLLALGRGKFWVSDFLCGTELILLGLSRRRGFSEFLAHTTSILFNNSFSVCLLASSSRLGTLEGRQDLCDFSALGTQPRARYRINTQQEHDYRDHLCPHLHPRQKSELFRSKFLVVFV